MIAQPNAFPRHRFPAETISHAVWLYQVSSLSPRDVELIFAQKRLNCAGHGLKIRGTRMKCSSASTGVLRYVLRAVDQHGVLDILV